MCIRDRNAGVSYEHSSTYGGEWVPQGGVTVRPFEGTDVYKRQAITNVTISRLSAFIVRYVFLGLRKYLHQGLRPQDVYKRPVLHFSLLA